MVSLLPVALVIALGAGFLAWRQATRLDRRSFHDCRMALSPLDGRARDRALGAIVVAAAAATAFQLVLLSGL
jgi:hypothetical protein